jgi:chaperonin cofactor prefoldin
MNIVAILKMMGVEIHQSQIDDVMHNMQSVKQAFDDLVAEKSEFKRQVHYIYNANKNAHKEVMDALEQLDIRLKNIENKIDN